MHCVYNFIFCFRLHHHHHHQHSTFSSLHPRLGTKIHLNDSAHEFSVFKVQRRARIRYSQNPLLGILARILSLSLCYSVASLLYFLFISSNAPWRGGESNSATFCFSASMKHVFGWRERPPPNMLAILVPSGIIKRIDTRIVETIKLIARKKKYSEGIHLKLHTFAWRIFVKRIKLP